ncbi:TPA: hypothetical protein QDZ95_003539 [Shewanella algae]|uniref:hypothetical protein n=1 Tax=Shewanella algae TaxID=38313 RepID=UPI001C5A24D4|nr:hypothetical protein [Shewanella algae]HDS1199991.1 hypothetical protein [Shewanella algae]
MSEANTLFIGLDGFKETTDVTWVSDKSAETVHYHGTIPTNLRSFDKLIKNQTAKTSKLCVIYEAGPCGFWLYHHLSRRGLECWVVAAIFTLFMCRMSVMKLSVPGKIPCSICVRRGNG